MRKIPIKSAHPHATFMFAENIPKNDYNVCKIGQLNHMEIRIDAIDVFPVSNPIHLQTSVSSRFSGTTVGLPSLLNLEKGARQILTRVIT